MRPIQRNTGYSGKKTAPTWSTVMDSTAMRLEKVSIQIGSELGLVFQPYHNRNPPVSMENCKIKTELPSPMALRSLFRPDQPVTFWNRTPVSSDRLRCPLPRRRTGLPNRIQSFTLELSSICPTRCAACFTALIWIMISSSGAPSDTIFSIPATCPEIPGAAG